MRTFIIILFAVLGVRQCAFGKSLEEILRAMPSSFIPYLTDNQREEMSKFTEGMKSVEVNNIFNGKTAVDTISSDFAVIRLNAVADMQVRLLSAPDSSQIVCLVKTVRKPLAESSISFYTTDWQPVESRFGLPDIGDAGVMMQMLVERPDSIDAIRFNRLCSYIEPVMVSADCSNDDNIITYSLSLLFVTKDKADEIKAVIKKKSFKWDGKTFNEY